MGNVNLTKHNIDEIWLGCWYYIIVIIISLITKNIYEKNIYQIINVKNLICLTNINIYKYD